MLNKKGFGGCNFSLVSVWVSYLAYPNLLGTKGLDVVVVVVSLSDGVVAAPWRRSLLGGATLGAFGPFSAGRRGCGVWAVAVFSLKWQASRRWSCSASLLLGGSVSGCNSSSRVSAPSSGLGFPVSTG